VDGVVGASASGGIAVAGGTVVCVALATFAAFFCLSFVSAPMANPAPTPTARSAAIAAAIHSLVPGARR
jgi:hypothetical protein